MTLVGGARGDLVQNRLTDDIHQAVKQFDAVNSDFSYPNVLAFSNNPRSHCNYADLFGVLTGLFFAESGGRFPIYTHYSEGRIRDEKSRINLYIWIEDNDKPYFFFPDVKRQHEQDLCRLFGKDPSAIRRLDA
jgi:hypothetical protein